MGCRERVLLVIGADVGRLRLFGELWGRVSSCSVSCLHGTFVRCCWCGIAVSLDDFAGGVLVTAAYRVVYLVEVRTPGVANVVERCLAVPLLPDACPMSGPRWDMAVQKVHIHTIFEPTATYGKGLCNILTSRLPLYKL